MHVHMPKPIHGWRQFFGEVGIIVVGVLIALFAEKTVTDYEWERKSEAGEEALKAEARDASLIFAEQLIVAPCVLAQIDKLRTQVLASDGMPLDAPVIDTSAGKAVVRAPDRGLTSELWTSLLNDGTSTHMDLARRQATADYYAQAVTWSDLSHQGRALRDGLVVLSEHLPLDPRAKWDTLQNLDRLRNQTLLFTLVSKQMLARARDLNRLPSDDIIRAARPSESGSTVGFCKKNGLPLGSWREELAQIPAKKV